MQNRTISFQTTNIIGGGRNTSNSFRIYRPKSFTHITPVALARKTPPGFSIETAAGLSPSCYRGYRVMKIFAIIPLSPSVLDPSNSGRNVSSIASSELHPSATSLAAASVSRVDIVHEISCLP